MWPHFVATLEAVLLGFAVGAVAALPTGYVLARSRLASRVLSPYLVAAQATPILALAPLIALWFGSGLLAQGHHLRPHRLLPGCRLHAGRDPDSRRPPPGDGTQPTARRGCQRIAKLEVPAALPSIFGGLRIGVTLAVVGAIVAEWAGGEHGLGVLINLARGSLFDIPLMFATLMTIGLLGLALYGIVLLVERRVLGGRY